MSTLVLINGAPGVGKTTAARRHVDDRPGALLIDIDDIRMELDDWFARPETRQQARDAAVKRAHAHLLTGGDVFIPQYVERVEFIERLGEVARSARAHFREFLLEEPVALIVARFFDRRAELDVRGEPHPQHDITDDAVVSTIAAAHTRLRESAKQRGIPIVGSIELAELLERVCDG